MARIRTIKPEFWRVTYDLSEGAALLFIALWNFADDYGVVELDPDIIKANVYPRRDIRMKDIVDRIDELRSTNRLIPYRVNGERYGWITKFDEHQVINRKGDHLYPAPPDRLVNEFRDRSAVVIYDDEMIVAVKPDETGIRSDSLNPHGALREDSVNPHGALRAGTGNREQGTGSGSSRAPAHEEKIQVENPVKKYGEFVELIDTDHEKLVKQFGADQVDLYIKRINNHIGSTGTRYRSHYWTLRKWMEKDLGDGCCEEKPHGLTAAAAADVEEYCQRMIEVNRDANERFRIGVIEPLREEISELTWESFIDKMIVIDETADTVTVYHPSGDWVAEHYGERIKKKMIGRKLVLVSSIPEGAPA